MPEIIAEFSETVAFVRGRWARYAAEFHPELKKAGIAMLQVIRRNGSTTATELCQLLDMDKALVSRQITKLRELGLVDAAATPEDRRVVCLTASDQAVEFLDGIRVRWAETYRERFTDWSVEDLQQLKIGLRRFNQDQG
nr:MarR family transcriptional regulator [Leucobacter exalbidus]